MARQIIEVYFQIDGRLYVSRDNQETGQCIGCAFHGLPIGDNCIAYNGDRFLCVSLKCIWKELPNE